MKEAELALLDPVADLTNDRFEELHPKGAFNEILERLKQVMAQFPGDNSVSFDMQMNVFDNNRERSLRLLDRGFNATKGEEPYRHYGDSTAQKYLVDGEICIVPDDYCPHCWGDWGFKFEHPACPQCGYGRSSPGALLDRLTHHVPILEIVADSYRLKSSLDKGKEKPA